MFLAVSEEYEAKTLPIWRRLCHRLCVVRLPGEHMDIFQAPAADPLIQAFEDNVRTASSLGFGREFPDTSVASSQLLVKAEE